MSRGDGSDLDKSVEVLLAAADWDVLALELLRRAQSILQGLGLAEGRDHRPALIEAWQVVNTAVEAVRSGDRKWPVDVPVTEDRLLAVLRQDMVSITLNNRKSAAYARRADGDEALEHQDEQPSASTRFAEMDLLQRCDQALQGHDEPLLAFRTMRAGHTKPRDLHEVLGWHIDHVTVVLRRMRRLLASRGIHRNDDSASEPPS